ncbi:MAG: PhoU domain-containing protein [Acidimicrobiales bacterium]|jgi:phosphate transport system protein
MAQFALPDDHMALSAEGQNDPGRPQLTEDVPAAGRLGNVRSGDSDRILSPVRCDAEALIDAALIDRQVIQLFALVENAVAGATHAMVSGDHEAARVVVAADADIDSLYLELEASVQARLLERPTNPAEMRYLLAVLGMLPELERSGDLAEHVARRATRNLPAEIPARLRGYVQRMGEVACAMWRIAADSYGSDAGGTTERLVSLDDEMDDLHVSFIAELVAAGTPVVVAIELALVGRFYERLGDHAVNLARRVPTRLSPVEP